MGLVIEEITFGVQNVFLTADPVVMCTGALGLVYGFSFEPLRI